MKTVCLLLLCAVSSFALAPSEEAKVKEVAREYIKDHLKAPATAVFSKETVCAPLGKPDFEEVKGTGPTPECKPQSAAKVGDREDSVVYRGSVDSQNSYGALIRTKFQLQIYFTDGKWSIHDAVEIAKLLKQCCMDLNDAKRRGVFGDQTKPDRNCAAEFPGIE